MLEKILDRKPRDCQRCGFAKWIKGDKLFIVAGNEWLCPDCAVTGGLPAEYYYRNHYATLPIPKAVEQAATAGGRNRPPPSGQSGLGELLACMCYF